MNESANGIANNNRASYLMFTRVFEEFADVVAGKDASLSKTISEALLEADYMRLK